jgi:hypothetical protein
VLASILSNGKTLVKHHTRPCLQLFARASELAAVCQDVAAAWRPHGGSAALPRYKLSGVEIHPVTLGLGQPRHLRGFRGLNGGPEGIRTSDLRSAGTRALDR